VRLEQVRRKRIACGAVAMAKYVSDANVRHISSFPHLIDYTIGWATGKIQMFPTKGPNGLFLFCAKHEHIE